MSDSSAAASPVPDSGIGAMLVSSRSLAEYRAMFALTDTDLRRRILDCPGGASSFTAEVNASGGAAIACDPVYAQAGVDELAGQAQAETDRGNRYVRANPEQYAWTFFANPDEHHRTRSAAGVVFAADRRAHPGQYLPASLPQLPFADRAFDLVLSSHLLFSWADRLDLAFHRAALLELMRVARRELRVFPLVAIASRSYPHRDELLAQLHDDGISAREVDVDYEFQAGGNQMLVCTRRE